MKQYYKCIKLFKGEQPSITYWLGDNTKHGAIAHLIYAFDFIIPLGLKLPANVSRETIKTF